MGKTSWIGDDMLRKEDERLLRGAGRFVDDCDDPRMLHVAIARCPFPHARIRGIDLEAARALPGVTAILTGAEVVSRSEPITVLRPLPGLKEHAYYAMASEIARFEGEPVVAVAAHDRYVAEDAIELIAIDYEPLPHVVEAEAAAAKDAPVLHGTLGTNVIVDNSTEYGDPDGGLAGAAAVAQDRFQIGRVMGLPIETRGTVARFDRISGTLDVVSSNQSPHLTRTQLALALRMPEGLVRFSAGSIGGSFGNKLGLYPEDIIVSLFAIDTGRPVKWIEDRMEHFRSTVHGREATHNIRLGASADGRIVGLDDDYFIDVGAYNGPWGPSVLANVTLPGPYNITNFRSRRRVVTTNKVPMGAYRGYGPPESNFVREVLVERLARQIGMDPAEMRRRNFVRPDQMPFTSATGAIYDSGDYARCMEVALEKLGYEKLRIEQREARSEGRFMGIGLSCYVEHAGYSAAANSLGRGTGRRFGAYESATVRMDASGKATLATGIPNFGQSVETSFAQICSTSLGIDPSDVIVLAGDTQGTPQSVGAFGSRGTLSGGGAIVKAAEVIRAKILRLAAHALEVPLETLEIAQGVITSPDLPGTRLTVAEVAEMAIIGLGLPQGEEPGLEATAYWAQPAPSWGFGTVAAVVDVDIRSGEVKLRRYLIAHDCGTRLNPKLVEGQVNGGIIQGLGATLMEGIVYDRDTGQMVNGSLVDYMVPTAADLPDFELAHTESPSPYTPFGMKGVGESGVIGAAAAVANAVADALAPLGVEVNRIPITPENLWRSLRAAERTTA
jgi:carbon-monoxide dehydrogenase large subunit